jgi:hypothetical protein
MKIDYKNYPILEKLINKELDKVPLNRIDSEEIKVLTPLLGNEWKKYNKTFVKEITVVTKPFMLAVQKSMPQLMVLYNQMIIAGDINLGGTFVFGERVIMIDYYKQKESLFPKAAMYVFDRWGGPLMIYMSLPTSLETTKEGKWVSKLLLNTEPDVPIEAFLINTLQIIHAVTLFKQYAEVETKILHPHQRPHDIACAYRNNTKFDVTFLDSKWFTNLVKSDGFNVRGHFRLQPKKKNGEWTKELIWISEFHKTGYTAQAKIITYNPQE